MSAGTSRLTPKARSRFQLQRTPPNTSDILAKQSGRRPEPSIRGCRANAALAAAARHLWSALWSSDGLIRSKRPCSNEERSRVGLPRTARIDQNLRGRVHRFTVNDIVVGVPIVVTNPGHRESQGVFIASLRHEVEVVVRAKQCVEAASVG